jgi:spermidine synthase
MQKHLRAAVGSLSRIAPGRSVYLEALNPWSGFFYTVRKTLLRNRTRFQDLTLLDTDEFGKVLLLDNITQVADKNDFHYHEPMVHPALCSHPLPRSVLIIGGGDGGILREVFKYPCVQTVDLAELDDGVIAFSKKYLSKVHGGAFRDPRLRIHVTEGRRFVAKRRGAYDIVIMDMTDPSGPSTLLYTREFFSNVRQSFRNRDGVFVMHSESPVARPGAFACIQKTLRAVFPVVIPHYLYIPMYGILWSITLSGCASAPASVKPATLDAKLARYGIRGLKVYSGATHHAMQTPYPYLSTLLARPARVITDARPEFPDDFLFQNHSRKRVKR